jgi:solute carrier family 40 (iron-regulated transporter), member 1
VEIVLPFIRFWCIVRVIHTLFYRPEFWRYILKLFFLMYLGSMITFLSQYSDLSTPLIAGLRAIGVVMGILATFVAPRIIRKVGAIRAGLWFLSWQTILLIPVAIIVFLSMDKRLQGGLLVGFVSLSRLGLWGFDLSEQFLVQQVPSSDLCILIGGN